jgi:predicted hydrocarbon binding protein
MSNLADSITKWGFTAILMKNLYNLKTPGFITENISANKIGSSRHVFLSENSISNIEIKLIEKFGNKAEQILYSIGKEFGFSYVNFMKGFNLKSPTRKIKISFIFRFFEV